MGVPTGLTGFEPPAQWVNLTNVPASAAPRPVVDPSGTAGPQRFYRVVVP